MSNTEGNNLPWYYGIFNAEMLKQIDERIKGMSEQEKKDFIDGKISLFEQMNGESKTKNPQSL